MKNKSFQQLVVKFLKHYSIKEAAKSLGVSHLTIEHWASGKNSPHNKIKPTIIEIINSKMNTNNLVLEKSFLKHIHTKVLLKIFRKMCVNNEQLQKDFLENYDEDHEFAVRLNPKFTTVKDELYERYNVPPECFGFTEENKKSNITIADLKEELSTREHIPNKIEAKQIRKNKAKANRNKGRKNK